jgi:hypothetical protein
MPVRPSPPASIIRAVAHMSLSRITEGLAFSPANIGKAVAASVINVVVFISLSLTISISISISSRVQEPFLKGSSRVHYL